MAGHTVSKWRGEAGAGAAASAAVALGALLLITAVLGAGRALSPQVGRAFGCLIDALGDGSLSCPGAGDADAASRNGASTADAGDVSFAIAPGAAQQYSFAVEPLRALVSRQSAPELTIAETAVVTETDVPATRTGTPGAGKPSETRTDVSETPDMPVPEAGPVAVPPTPVPVLPRSAATSTADPAPAFDPSQCDDIDIAICRTAQENVPVLYRHPKEADKYELCNASDYYALDPEAAENGRVTPPDDMSFDSPWLCSDVDAGDRPPTAAEQGKPDPGAGPDVYWVYDGDTHSITYWFFFCNDRDHEGDWESVTFYLNNDGEFTHACYSAHGESQCFAGDARCIDGTPGRPTVYAALEKHGLFPWPESVGQDEREKNEQYEQTGSRRADGEPWWSFTGRWGTSSSRSLSGCKPNSPSSPSVQMEDVRKPKGQEKQIPKPGERTSDPSCGLVPLS